MGGTDFLTSKQAADRICVGERTLRDLRKRGLIRYVAVTERKIMYRPEDCDEYLASRLRRDESCPKHQKPPRRTKGRQYRGNVIPFEKLAEQRGW